MQLTPKNKKGVITLGQAGTVVIVLLTVGIVLVVGLLVLADLKAQVVSTLSLNVSNASSIGESFAYNGSQSAEEGLDVIASFQSIFGIVVAAAVVLGLVALFR